MTRLLIPLSLHRSHRESCSHTCPRHLLDRVTRDARRPRWACALAAVRCAPCLTAPALEPPENARYRYTRRGGHHGCPAVHRNSVQKSTSSWWLARKFLDSMRTEGICRQVRVLGQNPKIACQKFNVLQTAKLSKNH